MRLRSTDWKSSLKDTNRKVNSHASDVAKVKENLKKIEKLANNASSEVEQISQYLRRDCLEITGIATNAECSAEAIIKSIGDVIGVPLQDNDFSIAHPIPTYKVKFTRRSVRNKFYSNRRKLARKKAKAPAESQPIIRSRRVRFRVANPIQEKALWRCQQSEKAS